MVKGFCEICNKIKDNCKVFDVGEGQKFYVCFDCLNEEKYCCSCRYFQPVNHFLNRVLGFLGVCRLRLNHLLNLRRKGKRFYGVPLNGKPGSTIPDLCFVLFDAKKCRFFQVGERMGSKTTTVEPPLSLGIWVGFPLTGELSATSPSQGILVHQPGSFEPIPPKRGG